MICSTSILQYRNIIIIQTCSKHWIYKLLVSYRLSSMFLRWGLMHGGMTKLWSIPTLTYPVLVSSWHCGFFVVSPMLVHVPQYILYHLSLSGSDIVPYESMYCFVYVMAWKIAAYNTVYRTWFFFFFFFWGGCIIQLLGVILNDEHYHWSIRLYHVCEILFLKYSFCIRSFLL